MANVISGKTMVLRATVFAACMFACAAWGDTLTWSGSNAGSFTTPSNWTSADEGGTSTYGPRPGDTVKFTKAVDLTEETFDIGAAGLTIENSATLNNYVKFAGSGKIVKRGTGDMNLRTVSTHTGGTRLELGRIVMIVSSVKTFGTGPVEVVYNGTSSGYNSRPQIHFAAWGSGLTNELRVVNTHGDYAAFYCSNAATVSGPVYADGEFTIYNGYGSFAFTAPIHAHGHTVTAYCVDGRAGTYLNLKSSVDASLTKTGSKPMHISGVSDQIDAVLTVNDGGVTIDATGVWGGTNVVVNGATNVLTLTALSNFSTPPVVRLLNGGTLSMPSVVIHVAELWIDGTRQSDGLYTAANMPAGVHAPGGVLIVGSDHPFKVWTGGKSGLFSSGGNWSDGQPPATGDLLVFNKTVNLEAESTDIGAAGMSLYVGQSCILTNNNVFTGSGLLTKLGKGRIRERVELESTGGFKVTDGIVELIVGGKALFKTATREDHRQSALQLQCRRAVEPDEVERGHRVRQRLRRLRVLRPPACFRRDIRAWQNDEVHHQRPSFEQQDIATRRHRRLLARGVELLHGCRGHHGDVGQLAESGQFVHDDGRHEPPDGSRLLGRH